jgi:hypothetical protein
MLLDFLKILEEAAANGHPRLYGVEIKMGTQANLNGPRIPICAIQSVASASTRCSFIKPVSPVSL